MTTKEAINIIEDFKNLIIDLSNGNGDRSKINQSVAQVKNITYIAGTQKLMTVAPPPMIGGLIFRDVDPLDLLFTAPYGMDYEIHNAVIDIMDETIGILNANPEIIEKSKEKKSIGKNCNSPILDNSKVFVVHGRDNELKESVARFVEKLGLNAIILHEQVNGGKTIIEKFEDAANVGFTIVLLTPDDIGGLEGGEMHLRARQNVVFELGYFIGRLKRKHVVALVKGDIEIPSDIAGVAYIGVDPLGYWKMAVAKELKACGYKVDLNKLV